MRLVLSIVIAVLAASSARAGTIDVANQPSQMLHSGDSLLFLFSDANFATNANARGLSTLPAVVSFSLMSMPEDPAGLFSATLESLDGSTSAGFAGPLSWTPGLVQTSEYQKSVSLVGGWISLSSELSQQIFANNKAELLLTYSGPDITVLFPGQTLKQDFSVSVGGGGMSTGGVPYAVSLDAGDAPGILAPEPSSALLLMGFGAFFLMVSTGVRRFRRRRIH